MKKKIIISLLLFGFLASCSKQVETHIFKFSVDENKPVFIDEYLFETENKNSIKLTSGKIEWYLIDWNNNGIYDEVGIDYFGVKSPFKYRPVISVLEDKNYINHNGETYIIDKKNKFRRLVKAKFQMNNNISYISNFIPIELSNGKILNEDILRDYDKTIIYYWATWCAPCVEKLEQMELLKEKLENDKINFIPIYYKCSSSSVNELLDKKNLTFDPIEVSELSALNYQISALPEVYVFNKQGKLIAERFSTE